MGRNVGFCSQTITISVLVFQLCLLASLYYLENPRKSDTNLACEIVFPI
jgi:hypothetical protein